MAVEFRARSIKRGYSRNGRVKIENVIHSMCTSHNNHLRVKQIKTKTKNRQAAMMCACPKPSIIKIALLL